MRSHHSNFFKNSPQFTKCWLCCLFVALFLLYFHIYYWQQLTAGVPLLSSADVIHTFPTYHLLAPRQTLCTMNESAPQCVHLFNFSQMIFLGLKQYTSRSTSHGIAFLLSFEYLKRICIGSLQLTETNLNALTSRSELIQVMFVCKYS